MKKAHEAVQQTRQGLEMPFIFVILTSSERRCHNLVALAGLDFAAGGGGSDCALFSYSGRLGPSLEMVTVCGSLPNLGDSPVATPRKCRAKSTTAQDNLGSLLGRTIPIMRLAWVSRRHDPQDQLCSAPNYTCHTASLLGIDDVREHYNCLR